ncbi:tetratricopeptide repeat protein [bacterium]|nr:tetratricopeptide repeat protein [bacterium]MBP9809254.1 tetratricopeptide repeat protein [bacterium]
MPAQAASNNLEQANLLARAGRFEEAVPLFESSLTGLERQNGPDAPELAECLQNLADAYQSVGRYDDSLRTNWRLVRIGEKILGRVHPDMVSMLLKIAETNEMMGKTEDALHIVESAIATAKQCMQADNPLAVRLIERHTYLVNLMRNQGAMRSQYDDPSIYQGQNQVQVQSQAQLQDPRTQSHSHPASISAAQISAAQTTASEIGPPPEPQVHKQVLKHVQQQIQNQLQQQAAATNSQLTAVDPSIALNPPLSPQANAQFNQMEISQGSLGESGETAMQAFAREMLKDMPVAPASKTGFSQSAKFNETSGVHFPIIDAQEALALNPSLVPMPSPPQRSNGVEAKASYGNALARPESQEFEQFDDLGEEPYTAEAIASLTNRSKINTRSNAKGRRPSVSEQSRIRTGRLLKDFGIPLIAASVLIGLVIYLFSSKVAVKPGAAASKGTTTVYESPDQKKQLRLLGTEVIIANQDAATRIRLKRIKNNWGDLFSALAQSATEKQIWMADSSSAIKSEDGITYYLTNGPDNRVIEKMRQLANYAQLFWLNTGEYPRTVPPGAEIQFSYSSPYNGKALSIPILSDRTNDKDGTTMKLNLEGGVHLGNEETSLPGYIGCYGALYNENNILKCTKFFVRGSNRDGHFLTTDNDQIFVLSASNQNSNAAPSEVENKPKVVAKNGKRSKKIAKQKDSLPIKKPIDSQAAPVAQAKELSSIANAKPPEKPTTVYLTADAVLPLFLMHHLLPIFLAALAALSFVRARMVGFDIKGEEVASGSKAALVAGIIFSLLTVLCLVMQFAVFG